MSKNTKTVIAIVIVVIIVGILIAAYRSQNNPVANVQNTESGATTGQSQVATTGGQTVTATTTQATVQPGDSDQDLSQDASSVDTQMNGLNNDNASADQSLNGN